MSDIFLSYAREDKPVAKRLAERLEASGLSVWWDRVIPPGETWDEVIEKELAKARCVIVVWSAAAVASDWVRTEAGEALQSQKLFPVTIAQVKPPLAFRHLQHSDLVGWTGDAADPRFLQVVDAISARLQKAPRQVHAALPSSEPAGFRLETILPGTGTETVRLGLTEEAVISRLGSSQEKVVHAPDATVRYRQTHFSYHHLGLSLLFRDGKLKSISFIGRRPKFDAYLGTTIEGISVKSTENDIRAAYGTPVTQGKHRQYLKYPGIEFTLKPISRDIVEITVRLE